MPRISNYPTFFEDCKTINIFDLLKWGYLRQNACKSGIITWRRGDETNSEIFVIINTRTEFPFLEVDYKFNDKPIKYRVKLVTIASNIGKGVYWFFICPHSGKRCRKLYFLGGYFFHRSAFQGCFYEKQTYSSSKRTMYQSLEKLFGTDKLYDELYSKHFKKTYAGKPTKRYKRLWGKISNSDKILEIDILSHYTK